MQIVTFNRRVSIQQEIKNTKTKIVMAMNPGTRYLLDQETANHLQADPTTTFLEKVTDFEPYYKGLERPPHWRGKRVLFYRNHGIGDQLMFSMLPRVFADILGAIPYVLCNRIYEYFWINNDKVHGPPLEFPVHLDTVWRAKAKNQKLQPKPFFDYCFFVESVSEWDTEQEQLNVYDRLLEMCGLEPESIPDQYKKPYFPLTQVDIDSRADYLEKFSEYAGIKLNNGYIMFQLRPTNVGRMLPMDKNYVVLEVLSRLGIPVLCTDEQAISAEEDAMIRSLPNCYNVADSIKDVRLYAALIAGSKLTVGPDSANIHFAAAFNTPAIGLWGPFSPEVRTKYYTNQVHIWHPELCNNSPCFNYFPALPTHLCPRREKQMEVGCECFQGIKASEVEEALITLKIKKPEIKASKPEVTVLAGTYD